jgi:hypothetical protein
MVEVISPALAEIVDPLCVHVVGIPPGTPVAVQSIAHCPATLTEPKAQAPVPDVGFRIPDQAWALRHPEKQTKITENTVSRIYVIAGDLTHP